MYLIIFIKRPYLYRYLKKIKEFKRTSKSSFIISWKIFFAYFSPLRFKKSKKGKINQKILPFNIFCVLLTYK